MESYAIQMHGVCKRYPHFTLDDVDLNVATGSVMGFLGANGAGKSTTIRVMMGLVHPDRGDVRVLGRAMPAEQAQAKQDIGFVSDDLRLYCSRTLQWHMDLMASIYPRWDAAYANVLLGRFGLRALQKIGGVSHGQRVKAALLLALARRPRLLILDEPTTGLDPIARQEVLAELMAAMVDDERTILFSSHNTRDVEQIADAITFIDRGRIVDADDKETYLHRWRRIELDLPANVTLPAMPGMVSLVGQGRSRVLTTNQFSEEITSRCEAVGARVHAVQAMSLEEIFVSTVMDQRAEAA